jgi:hypothetical protein
MELQGTVKKLFEIQTFPSGFQKREMVLLTQEQYPQPVKIEFLSDNISLLDNIVEGEVVKVSINIRGREWTNPQGEVVYFNSITGWRVEKGNVAQAEPTQPIMPKGASTNQPNEDDVFTEDDDLPF